MRHPSIDLMRSLRNANSLRIILASLNFHHFLDPRENRCYHPAYLLFRVAGVECNLQATFALGDDGVLDREYAVSV